MALEKNRIGRRAALTKLATTVGAFTIVPRFVLGGTGFTAPSDQLTKGVIGVGGMGRGHLNYEGRTVAICDVEELHLALAREKIDGSVHEYGDFRELLQQDDIDVVHIATPPHWHALMTCAALAAGKDVWCEKPMTRTIGEGRSVVEAVARHQRMMRINTWFRFSDNFYGMGVPVKPIKKLVQNDVFGWPLKVTIGAATGFNWKFYWRGKNHLEPQTIPDTLNYDMWLGPAPAKPYHRHRVHNTFRGYWDYDGGGLGDMGQHYLDPVQYLLDKDDTGPVKIRVDAPQQDPDAAGTWRQIEFTYADGCQILLDGANRDTSAAFIEGPKGKLYKGMRSDVPNLNDLIRDLPDPAPQQDSFSDTVRTRTRFALNELNGHRSCSLVNLGIIAVRLGRNLEYDPLKQEFINDEVANRMINQPMRGSWSI